MHACAPNKDQHKTSSPQQTGRKCTQEQQTGSKRAPVQQIMIRIKQEQHSKQGANIHMSSNTRINDQNSHPTAKKCTIVRVEGSNPKVNKR